MEDASRELHLIVYSQPLFKAHWALFVPSINNARVGKKIHAVGDALNGFSITFDRNYNLGTTGRSHTLVHLGYIGAAYIDEASVLGNDLPITDNVAQDRLETYATSAPAPGPSLRPSLYSGSTKKRVEIRDCQTWMKDFITVLVEASVLNRDSLDVLDNAPKH
ncbi:hypothetical protein F503_06816 [Ophiostoma piceae UAMH 11346]|uniref:Uncharacterized protein n=1 Tax=Ophiostoma piceae (strain UAMH 11346) TaxID=1262450 RepID=S3D6K6_OPHP1|nr:hypothetical protein F503_06816 [Ophiostoma piceae UAMH 11346]